MILHKIIRQAQDSLSSYATEINSQLDYLMVMAGQDKAHTAYMDSKAWVEGEGILCLKNNHTIITAYKSGDTWSIFLVPQEDTKAQKALLKEIVEEAHDLEYLALGTDEFVLSTAPKEMGYYSQNGIKPSEFIVKNWAGDLRKTEHFMFELKDICRNLTEETGISPQYPVDTSSHDYQMKMASTQYSPTKMSFYEMAFLGAGTGYEWTDKGNLAYHGVTYNADVANIDISSIPMGEIEGIHNISEYSNRLLDYPENISPEWRQVRSQFINAIKEGIVAYPSWDKEKQNRFLDKSISIEELSRFIEKLKP